MPQSAPSASVLLIDGFAQLLHGDAEGFGNRPDRRPARSNRVALDFAIGAERDIGGVADLLLAQFALKAELTESGSERGIGRLSSGHRPPKHCRRRVLLSTTFTTRLLRRVIYDAPGREGPPARPGQKLRFRRAEGGVWRGARRRMLVLLVVVAVPASAQASGGEGITYSPEPGPGATGESPPSPNPTIAQSVPRLLFGFGAGTLALPRCWRADGSRRCHRAVIRSFADRPASRTVPCCNGSLVGGQLVSRDGRPMPEQSVDVVETFARGAHSPTRTTTLTTDASGAFRVRLAPGPSRRVSAYFPGNDLFPSASGRRLRLRVRAGVRLGVSAAKVRVDGAPVVFSGRVAHPGARIPPTGLFVELEFRLPGRAWSEFRTFQTDSRTGHFTYPYTFEDDDSAGVRFLFRAFVPRQGNWTFAPATSQPRAVTG